MTGQIAGNFCSSYFSGAAERRHPARVDPGLQAGDAGEAKPVLGAASFVLVFPVAFIVAGGIVTCCLCQLQQAPAWVQSARVRFLEV